MKRVLSLSFLLLLATMGLTAQNPKGLYHLQKFIYQDGKTRVPPFSQYKYAADSVGLLISYRPSRNITQWSQIMVEIREPFPLLNTGETPQGADGHGIQVFNVDDKQFYFKWYNDRWPNMSQLGEFITEVYEKVLEPEVATAFIMLENKVANKGLKAGKFGGWWMRTGSVANADGTGQHHPLPTRWKSYGPGLSMVLDVVGNGNVLQCFTTNTIKYENDTTLYEIGHPCNIHWLSDDCHTLTFVQENGQPLTEVWVRGGLPRKWQNVFGSDVPLYRDGNECMREAVEAAVKGNLQQAEKFIAEAFNEKDVSIEALSMGVMGIATDLYVSKRHYQECKEFCGRQLRSIEDYAGAGHDHNAKSKVYVHFIKAFHALATYRAGEQEEGKRLLENCISYVEAEIEKYRTMRNMEDYVNSLYFCNLLAYRLGYDLLGADRTLLYLDALTLMAPVVASQSKPMLLNCRGNCYLLLGNTESAKKLWKQIKEIDADYFKKQPDDDLLKKTFGE